MFCRLQAIALVLCTMLSVSVRGAEQSSFVGWFIGERGYQAEPEHYQVDPTTAKNLELVPEFVGPVLTLADSALGQFRLLWLLTHPYMNAVDIQERQQAVQTLVDNPQLLKVLRTYFKQLGDILGPRERLLTTVLDADKDPFRGKNLTDAVHTLAALGPVALNFQGNVSDLIGGGLAYGVIGLIDSITNWVSRGLREDVLLPLQGALVRSQRPIASLAQITSPVLQDIFRELDVENLPQELQQAHSALKFVGRKRSVRVLQDMTWASRITNRRAFYKSRHAKEAFGKFLGALSDLEALCAIAQFQIEHKREVAFPKVVESESPFIKLNNTHHPHILFGQDKLASMGNSLRMGTGEGVKSLILTGSNAGGKTTYLRQVALNLIFAQAGFPIPQEEMSEFTPMRVMTNFHVLDSTQKDTSTFDSQSQRVAEILRSSTDSAPILILADEILTGTTPEEHRAAEHAVFYAFHQKPHALTILATHDRSLTQLSEELPLVANAHVSAVGHHVLPGPATALNAFEIMEAAGVPSAVVEMARARFAHQRACEDMLKRSDSEVGIGSR